MRDELDIVETAEPLAHVPPPVLVVLPDPEARVDAAHRLFGRTSVERVAAAAREHGFAAVLMGPGSADGPEGATPMATGDRIGLPALVVYEGTVVHPGLLELMVAHPLEEDERYSLYDAAGRPCGSFSGDLRSMPSSMPISEELPWPAEYGPRDVVRMVYDDDIERAEQLVLRAERAWVLDADSLWRRRLGQPVLRWLTNAPRPLAQLELVALAVALLSLPLALWATHLGRLAAALALLAGVHVSSLITAARALRHHEDEPAHANVGHRLAPATRPLGQAALTVGLTYAIVAPTGRSGVAALVLLLAGVATALLALFQARLVLQRRPADVFALPDAGALARRLGLSLPRAIEGAPLLELAVVVAAIPGPPVLPWSLLGASAVARLWRWFAGPSGPDESGAAVDGLA
jgi:hypothetical protein